jgi:glutamate racemase
MAKKNQISSSSPIGIFDSGFGGLSIREEVKKILPNELMIYLADSKNAPYGEKSKDEIIAFGIKNTELLLSFGCKIIIVACNTATTNSISILRERFEVPFIGIEPAIKPAALSSKTGKIGVLATKGTLSSDLFISTSNTLGTELEIIEAEGKGLVRLIEDGHIFETETLLKEYLNPMVEKGIDNLVLGCTHYPFLVPIIKKIIPDSINIIDSGTAVAQQTKKLLIGNNLLNNLGKNEKDIVYTNSNLEILNLFLKQIEATNYSSQQLDF